MNHNIAIASVRGAAVETVLPCLTLGARAAAAIFARNLPCRGAEQPSQLCDAIYI